MKKLRRFLVISVMVLTVFATAGVFNINSAKAAASAGDLIKMAGNSSVYYLGADGKRYVFPNSTTYFSWYPDFSGVVTIPAAELQSYPLGGNVTMRPGTKLVKITTDPSVYAVEPNGTLRKIQSEAQAAALYGTNWNKRVVDVPDAFFTNYHVGSALADSTIPTGSLVKSASSANVYYFDGTNYRLIANDAAMAANKFIASNVLTVNNTITAAGATITGMESALFTPSQNGVTGGVTVTGSGLMVSLNAATAPSNTVIAGQALANLASFNFTAANDGSVTVNSIKIKRIGISSDSDISNVYLYNGNTKLTDNGSFGNGYVTFSSSNGIITVPAGQTVTLTVKADVAGNSGNVGVAINAASDIVASAASVSGSFPLNGNLMSMVSNANLARTVVGAITTPGTSINAGTMNATLWSAPFQVSQKAVNLSYISFKQIGSIPTDAITNLTLYVNGLAVGSKTSVTSDNRVIFDLSGSPVTLPTGSTTVELRGDVVKGSSRTFSFALQTASDAVLTDTNFNVNIAATGAGINSSASTTISAGTISVALDPNFTTNQVVKNASNVTLAKFTMKAYGEDVKVNSITVRPSTTGNLQATEGLNNVSLYLNGAQVGSSQNDIATAAQVGGTALTDLVFGTNNLFTLTAGQTATLEIRADINLLTSPATTVTAIKTDLQSGTTQGVYSFDTSHPITTVAGTSQTVVSGNLVVSPNTSFQGQTVSKNTANQKIGSFVIQAGNAESVRVTNLKVSLSGTATVGATDFTKISNLYISDNTTPVPPVADNNFPVNITLSANQNHTVDVFADLGNITDGQTVISSLTVTATGQSTNTSVGGSKVAGQTLTINTSTLNAPTLVANTPASRLVSAGNSLATATYKFSVNNAPATINEIKINVVKSDGSTVNATAVSAITIGSVTAPVVCDSPATVCQADVTGLNLVVPAGVSGLNVAVTPTYNNVTSAGQGGALTNNDVRLNLVSFKSTLGNTQVTTNVGDAALPAAVSSATMVLVSSVPTVALASDNPAGMSSGFTAGGSTDAMHFTVSNSGSNPINLRTISVTPIFTGNLGGATQKIKVYDSADLNTALNGAGTNMSITTNTQTQIAFDADSVIQANSSKTYVIKVDTTGLTGSGNSFRIDLTAANDTAYAAAGTATAHDWAWNDSTIANYMDGYLVKNLPLAGNTFVRQ